MIDLSQLPPPDVIEALSYEEILAQRISSMRERLTAANILPNWDPTRESDPIVIELQESAYREFLLRQRVNDACRAVMLSSATGNDLVQYGAAFGVTRQVIQAADPTTRPPTPEILEPEERFRQRIQMAWEALSTAGPSGAYKFHTLSASPRVLDCDVSRPRAGDILITILSIDGDGTADQALTDTVRTYLSDGKKRPLNDTVFVASAAIVPYEVSALLEIEYGPDHDAVISAATTAVQAYVTACHRVGAVVARSGLDGALHRPGVRRVILADPVDDIITDRVSAPFCIKITVLGA